MVLPPDFEDTMTKYGIRYRLERVLGEIKTFAQEPDSKGTIADEKECDPKQLPHELWMEYAVLAEGGTPIRPELRASAR